MTYTRRGFLGAVLTGLAWLGLGSPVPKVPATTELPLWLMKGSRIEGKIDLGPADGASELELMGKLADAAQDAAAELGRTGSLWAPGPDWIWLQFAWDHKEHRYIRVYDEV